MTKKEELAKKAPPSPAKSPKNAKSNPSQKDESQSAKSLNSPKKANRPSKETTGEKKKPAQQERKSNSSKLTNTSNFKKNNDNSPKEKQSTQKPQSSLNTAQVAGPYAKKSNNAGKNDPRQSVETSNTRKSGGRKGKGKGKKTETGVCKWFDSQKGFGFILSDKDSAEIFVHNSEIKSGGFRMLQQGERVEYNYEYEGPGKEKKKALNVTGPNGGPVRGDYTAVKANAKEFGVRSVNLNDVIPGNAFGRQPSSRSSYPLRLDANPGDFGQSAYVPTPYFMQIQNPWLAALNQWAYLPQQLEVGYGW